MPATVTGMQMYLYMWIEMDPECGLRWILSADALQKYFVTVNVRIFPRKLCGEKKSGSFSSPWLGAAGIVDKIRSFNSN